MQPTSCNTTACVGVAREPGLASRRRHIAARPPANAGNLPPLPACYATLCIGLVPGRASSVPGTGFKPVPTGEGHWHQACTWLMRTTIDQLCYFLDSEAASVADGGSSEASPPLPSLAPAAAAASAASLAALRIICMKMPKSDMASNRSTCRDSCAQCARARQCASTARSRTTKELLDTGSSSKSCFSHKKKSSTEMPSSITLSSRRFSNTSTNCAASHRASGRS